MQYTIDIAGIAALVLSFIALYKAFRLTPKEIATSDADASGKYAEAARLTAEQTAKLLLRVDELDKELTSLKAKVNKQTSLLKEWQKGIERLIHQIQSLGSVPVWNPDPINLEENDETNN